MKILRAFTFLVLCCITVVMTSCDDEEVVPGEDEFVAELSADPLTLDYTGAGGEKIIEIKSNTIWKVTFTNVTWARSSIQTSLGNAGIRITADVNDSTHEREGTFTISANGVNDIIITVNQEGKEETVTDPGPEYADYIVPDDTDMRNIPAIQYAGLMSLGWNLGNSLEAINVNNGIYSGGETSWGNPVVTRQLIDAVKSAGFDAIRIPVSWSHKMDDPETFKISFEWKLRIEEVINYALDNDMFVTINIHWDGGWMNQPYYDRQEKINERLAAMWHQIAVWFRDYDDRLMFAGTNEVHVAGNYGTPSLENLDVQNSFNQTFVNTVRATGGRNHYRHLAVQGYNTNISQTIDGFVLPDDAVANKLMVEVHYYDPVGFALTEENNGKTQWGEPFSGGDVDNWGQEAWVHSQFALMKSKFTDEGIPVILGEYGAIHRTSLVGQAYDNHKASREYYLEYITRTAIEYGLTPFYWDNGYAGNHGFALFNRNNGNVVDQGALDAILAGAADLDLETPL